MTPARVLVVTGTNTDVGKTVAAAAMIAAAGAHGLRASYIKPAQTGLRAGEAGSDADEVRRLAGDIETHEFLRLPDPLAPAAAARVAGADLPPVSEHAARIDALARRGDLDLVLVEGAGGLLVHLDREGGTLADLAELLVRRGLTTGVIVVADPALGTLNLCALTQEALDARGLPCTGYVFGTWPVADVGLVLEQNVLDLPPITGRPLLGRVPAAAASLDPLVFRDRAPTWLDLPH